MDDCGSICFRLRYPAKLRLITDLFLPTAAHAALSLHLPQAALELAVIPNTEVKYM